MSIPALGTQKPVDHKKDTKCCGCFGHRKVTHHAIDANDKHAAEFRDAVLQGHTLTVPTLSESGTWEVEIDGVKQKLK